MLKVYTDQTYLGEKYRKHIFPLLLDLHFLDASELKMHYELVERHEDSDLAIYPLNTVYAIRSGKQSEIDRFVADARAADRQVWLYSGGDMGLSLDYEGTVNFRLGGFHSKMKPNTEILPSFIQDPVKDHFGGAFHLKEKTQRAEIGFVGHARAGTVKWIKEATNHLKWTLKRVGGKKYSDYQGFYPSSVKRARYLKMLQKDREMDCNFVLRNKYRAGVISEEEKQRTTAEFYQNIHDTLYTFCIRGLGNFSVRFYEILAMGRIPIMIDTDCRLPLNRQINWEEHALILPESEVDQLSQRIREFHKSHSEDQIKAIQESNRQLWLEMLHRNGYFKAIHDQFLNIEHRA